MLDKLFGTRKFVKDTAPELMNSRQRMQAVEGSSTAELAAQLLIAPTALMQLSYDTQ